MPHDPLMDSEDFDDLITDIFGGIAGRNADPVYT